MVEEVRLSVGSWHLRIGITKEVSVLIAERGSIFVQFLNLYKDL